MSRSGAHRGFRGEGREATEGSKSIKSIGLRKKAQPFPDAPYKISLLYKASVEKTFDFFQPRPI